MASQPLLRRFWSCTLAGSLLAGSGCVTWLPWASEEHSVTAQNAPSQGPELPAAKNAQLHWNLAERLEKSGSDADAAACYEKARSLDPHLPNVARRLAAIYDRLGETKRALDEYRVALKASPRDAQLLNRFGYFHYSRGQWEEAESQFRQALAINPNLQHAWVNLGLTLAQERRYDDSVEAFTKAVSKADALSNVAFVLTTQGKRDEAKQTYRAALALDPNLAIARMALQKLESPGSAAKSPPPAVPALLETDPAPLPKQSPIVVEGPQRGGGTDASALHDGPQAK
jgi:Tfp pilus assembly protein PilF